MKEPPPDASHRHPHPGSHYTHEHADSDPTISALGRDAEAHRPALAARSGVGRCLFFDAPSGIAGDMTIAALVDLGVPFAVVRSATEQLGVRGIELHLETRYAGAIGATHFHVQATEQQPARDYRQIDALLVSAPLDEGVRRLSRAIFRTLAEAEAEVHRIDLGSVHFHEVGAVDALVDIVGAAACFEFLGARVICSPLPMGRGTVACEHGMLPLPAPATISCLKGVPTYYAGLDAELVTPTGAAIIKTVASSFASWPTFIPDRIGWGKGTRELPDRPNVLRVVLGDLDQQTSEPAGHVLVEANVDDMTGELVAHAIEALLSAGAVDAWAVPVTMKKGRPGLTVCALAPIASAQRVSESMLRETTSLGLRRLPVGRLERPRRTERITTRFGPIDVKLSEGVGGPMQVKPEFSQCAEAARRFGVPAREVVQEALTAALASLRPG